jgi:predicted metal-binding protein
MSDKAQLDEFCGLARRMGAHDAVLVAPRKVVTAAWVRMRCQFGCPVYGQCRTCPPHSPTPDATRKMLDEYQHGILLHGARTGHLREVARELELKVFLAGYYKAFAFLCGPCDLCKTCVVEKGRKPLHCRHAEQARPAMEAAGIDVFATARAAGLPIDVITTPTCKQNYYALVLVE